VLIERIVRRTLGIKNHVVKGVMGDEGGNEGIFGTGELQAKMGRDANFLYRKKQSAFAVLYKVYYHCSQLENNQEGETIWVR
jgi:hypothetical protein